MESMRPSKPLYQMLFIISFYMAVKDGAYFHREHYLKFRVLKMLGVQMLWDGYFAAVGEIHVFCHMVRLLGDGEMCVNAVNINIIFNIARWKVADK